VCIATWDLTCHARRRSAYQGARFRLSNLVDDYYRETISIEVDTSLRSEWLVRLFERIKTERPLPDFLRVDNGPEFLEEVFSDWCAEHGIFILLYRTQKAGSECLYRAIQSQR
jgi:hypothetical protein